MTIQQFIAELRALDIPAGEELPVVVVIGGWVDGSEHRPQHPVQRVEKAYDTVVIIVTSGGA